MATLVKPPPLESTQRFVLRDVSWQAFKAFLTHLGDHRAVRMAYDQGVLELMSPSRKHEFYKRILARIVSQLTLELSIPLESGGSTTFTREDLQRGLEPDECFWIEHAPLVRGKLQLDLREDPPPDLAIEIDITSSSINRETIYAALGVPEIWRFNGIRLQVLRLQQNGQYEESARSGVFPFLPVQELLPFLQPDDQMDETTRLRRFIAWLCDQNFHV